MSTPSIEVFETEDRTFPPERDFVTAALTSDRAIYAEAEADYEAFWARQARTHLTWYQYFTTTLE